jgi:hypothetical protein
MNSIPPIPNLVAHGVSVQANIQIEMLSYGDRQETEGEKERQSLRCFRAKPGKP